MPAAKEQNLIVNQEEAKDFLALLKRINKENPSSEDVTKVKTILMNNPRFWEKWTGSSDTILYSYVKRIFKNTVEQVLTESEADNIKSQLGYFTTSQIEKLIIDQILLCWIGVIHIENRVTIFMTEGSHNAEEGVYWQNILVNYQNRYFRSIETLARVRKLNKSIAFQVNIAADGGQQVNVNEVIKKQD